MSIIFDIPRLHAPIHPERPTGTDLRQNTSSQSLYYHIKELRHLAKEAERRQSLGLAEDLSERPDWNKLFSACFDALTEQTKDLEIASWMLEALLRLQGFQGLKQGLEVLLHWIENYWDTLYPLPAEEGFHSRINPLVHLNGEDYEGTLIAPLYSTPLIPQGPKGPIALWQYQQALENSQLQDEAMREKRRSQGSWFMEDIRFAAKHMHPAFYETQQQVLKDMKATLLTLREKVATYCGEEFAPPVSRILQVLDTLEEHTHYLKQELGEISVTPTETTFSEEQPTSSTQTPVTVNQTSYSIKSIQTRTQALQMLDDIAEFFQKTEPQSPLPYLLKRTISLGQLSFPELLKVMVSDEHARKTASDWLGIEGEV